MSTETITKGNDFVIVRTNRTYGGRQCEVLRVDGHDGSVQYHSDVNINGSLIVNGQPIVPAPPGNPGNMTVETLGRPLVLSHEPTGLVYLFVNGQMQRQSDYQVNGRTVVWTCPDFTITSTDQVEAMY